MAGWQMEAHAFRKRKPAIRRSRPLIRAGQGGRFMGKGRRMCFFLALMLAAGCLLNGCADDIGADEDSKGYGVFIGASPEAAARLTGYGLVVVDADGMDKALVDLLRRNNDQVYSYLSIGSLEEFRSFYPAFRDQTLGPYENWDGEWWMDVSGKAWQEHLVKQAERYNSMGVDGLFLDNADVYAQYPRPEIYQGLLEIFRSLHRLGMPMIVNGGDVFVKKALVSDGLQQVLQGVNQESVFTSINFSGPSFGVSDPEDRDYFMEYVEVCRSCGLSVYLLEYGADAGTEEEIRRYCREKGFLCYISPSLELDAVD